MQSNIQSVPESLSDKAEVRDYLLSALKRDLIGPSWAENTLQENPNEVLNLQRKSPNTYYFCGYISPAKIDAEDSSTGVSSEDIIDVSNLSEEGLPPEKFTENSNSSNPSEDDSRHINGQVSNPGNFITPRSIGLTIRPFDFINQPIKLNITWGEYTLTDQNKEMRTWSRKPFNFDFLIEQSLFKDGNEQRIEIPNSNGLEIFLKEGNLNHQTMTIRLVNNRTYTSKDKNKSAEYTIHQPVMSLTSKFSEVRSPDFIEDDMSMALLYSDSKIYAKGHNVGVNWEDDTKVWTDFLPSFEVPIMQADSKLNDEIPTMEDFSSEGSVAESLDRMKKFMRKYKAWAASESVKFSDYDPDVYDNYEGIYDEHMGRVEETISRIEKGIDFLKSDAIARKAFVLSNDAIMQSQSSESLSELARIPNFRWRPFQICFQLLNVKGLLDPTDEDRGIVDLAWFPTGGGKTEAYLGLIAICSFHRRLSPNTANRELKSPGIHSIMRYTLRLLTADQAGRLVRACGAMNLVADKWEIGKMSGYTPFRVGMWIGRDTSPNSFFPNPKYPNNNTAEEIIDAAKGLTESGDCTVAQFPNCPWCGDSSVGDVKKYEIVKMSWSKERPVLSIKCAGESCPFNEGVPFTCVDEDIYLNPTSILLGTADKFAQLSLNPYPKSLKGRAKDLDKDDIWRKSDLENMDARNMMGFAMDSEGPLPPSLVIQDELHLLTGPLGTIAGLIECALDVAWKSTCDGHRVKYVAATATIRGAENDASLMYGRGLNIFPAPLLTIRDNFFAKEVGKDTKRGRLHVGIIAPHGKSRTLLNQPSASLLQNISTLRQKTQVSDEHLDPYWSLVLYYNSLRELGGGQSSLRKNIPQMIRLFAGQSGSEARVLSSEKELTSRRTGEELTQAKEHLDFTLQSGKDVVDVVSTSNMFQVGIDIGRLGIMGIVGQPRSNSEYIQSSGRVGRKHPGMVVSLLKGNYPRDQSHYELFRAFHQEIYSHVDQTSITPFSHRALDRAFASTMMMLLRSSIKHIKRSKDLSRLSNSDCNQDADDLIELFIEEIRKRQEDRGGISEQIISEGKTIIEKKYDRLKHFVKNCEHKNATAWWIIWNEKERIAEAANNPLSWIKSPFRRTNNPNEEDFEEAIGSFRDVAKETELAFVGKDDSKSSASFSMPESHLFSHMAPGHIWEKGGVPYLTLGISRWNNDLRESRQKIHQFAAFNNKTDQIPGLRINEPSLNSILGLNLQGKQRVLRSLPPYLDGKKQNGSVHVSKYPFHSICEAGHISTKSSYSKDRDGSFCARIGCDKPSSASRFVSICDNGHLSSFDYKRWAHLDVEGYDCNSNNIKLLEGENSAYTLDDWEVICEDCGASKTMMKVPWVESIDKKHAPLCQGNRPWLNPNWEADEDCNMRMVHRQVGNISVTYAEGASVLLIPPDVAFSLANHPVIQSLLITAETTGQSFEEFKQNYDAIRLVPGVLPIDDLLGGTYFDDDGEINHGEYLKMLWDYKGKHLGGEHLTLENLRGRERTGIIDNDSEGSLSIDPERFDKTSIAGNFGTFPEAWRDDDWPLRGATRVNRLTELKYIYGIDRLDPKESNNQPIDHPETRGNSPEEEFGIGMYNYGEGIFLDIKPSWLSNLKSKRDATISKESHREMAYSNDDRLRNIKRQINSLNYSKNNSAFTILHTLSHLIIRQLANSSGFSLGSIRERLYFDADEDGTTKQCGILLYTSGPSSDGTLGGLVRQGSSQKKIKDLIENVLSSLEQCSNDPVCSGHEPTVDEPNGAACHSCVLLPETSCELANHYLDRNWG